MVALHPYPRGFVLSDAEHLAKMPKGWPKIYLGNRNKYFLHDPRLKPDLEPVEGKDEWVLVYGLCLYAGLKDITDPPAKYLARNLADNEEAFLRALDFLGGRHVILHGTPHEIRIYNDATGMRSVYYSPEANLVASHVNLINDIVHHEVRTDSQGSRGAIAGWDRTRFQGVTSLIPNHYLRISDWSVKRFFPRNKNAYNSWTTGDKLNAFQVMWNQEMRNLINTESKLVMSLTGGADSRTSLALSIPHVDNLETFTYTVSQRRQTKWSESMALDKLLVEEIKSILDFKHRYFFFEDKELPLTKEINERLRKNTTQSHGYWLIPHYVDAFPEDNVVHLRGNAYEIGRAYWGTSRHNNTLRELLHLYMARTKKDKGFESEESRKADFQRGVAKWEYDKDLYDFHIRDLFYWEIRSGRWLAEILNETDIAFETCVPMNVRAMIEMSLAFTIEERKSGIFYSDLINASCPILNFPGKNTEKNLYEQKRDVEKAINKLGPEETPWSLHPRFTVTDAQGNRKNRQTTMDTICIPADNFTQGTTVSRFLRKVPSDGEVTFRVESFYSFDTAVGNWQCLVYVDGRIMAAWDGAERRRPVHVAITNVNRGSQISVQLRALKNQRGRESWETASRSRITNIIFRKRKLTGESAVFTDIPQRVR